jgi:hypothetical protein
VKEAAFDFQGVFRKVLPCFPGGTADPMSGSIEDAVVAGAEEGVVLCLPPNLAPQMGARAGEGHEIPGPSIPSLPGDVDGLSGRTLVEERLAHGDLVGFGYELPGEFVWARGVEIPEGDCAQPPVPSDEASGHSTS